MAIEKQRLKVSLYEDLNDPFEMFGASAPDRGERKALRKQKKKINKEYGLLCFSKTWQNTVMWSHYADRHRGVVLEFEAPDKCVFKMQYRSFRSNAENDFSKTIKELTNDNSDADREKLVQKLVEIKFRHWQYEQEIRMHIKRNNTTREIVEGKDLFFYNFGEDLILKKIFAGPLCKLSDKDICEVLPENRKIYVAYTRLAFKSFRVVYQKLKPERLVSEQTCNI